MYDIVYAYDKNTKFENGRTPLFPRADPPPPAPVRGPACLLRRTTPLDGGRAPVRLPGRLLSHPLLAFPPRDGSQLLPRRAPWTQGTAAQGLIARADHR